MTLAEIRTLVRQRADMEGSQFVTDAEVNKYINASYAELYDILVSRFDDYFSTTATFTLSGGANSYALPSDFYKARGLDLQVNGSDWATVRAFNFQERNARGRATSRLAYGFRNVTYRVMGSNLKFLPEDNAAGTYRFWYIPRFTPLASDSSQMGDVLDFEEYVVVDAAIKCLIKEESDPSALMAIKEQLKQRILSMAADRDVGEPEKISDVSGSEDVSDFLFPRG
jgi:hypothetical protein